MSTTRIAYHEAGHATVAIGRGVAIDRVAIVPSAFCRTSLEMEALERLAAAIAEGGSLATLVGAMRVREAKSDRLRSEIRALDVQCGALGRPEGQRAPPAGVPRRLARAAPQAHR